MERHHRRILHRRFARGTRRLQVDAQWRDIVRYSAGCHRRCLDRLQPHDGRQHQARGPSATTRRRRCVTERRPRCGCLKQFFRHNGPKSGSSIISRRSAWVPDERLLFGWFAFTARQIWWRSAFALFSASVLYLVSYSDMICTTSGGGVSRRRHELMESCSALRSCPPMSSFTFTMSQQAHSTRQLAGLVLQLARRTHTQSTIHLSTIR